jgi:hypothetical protein
MAEFIGNVFEHFCPEHWTPDSDNPPHEKCSICGKRHILSSVKVRAKKRQEEREVTHIPGLVETYEVQIRSPRVAGMDWDGEWIRWENKKKGTSSWQSLQRVKGSMKLMSDTPDIYRIIRVYTRPSVIEKVDVIEVIENKGIEPDFIRQDFSKRNLDEAERPTYETSKENIEMDS